MHAVEKLRRVDSLADALAGLEFRYEYRWIAAKGARRDPHKIARQVEDVVKQTAIFKQLPGCKLMGLDMPREMPNIVALVSIDPVVVLVIPWTNQGALNERSPDFPPRSTLSTELWSGDIDCGTSFAYRPGVLWLSPGVQDEPAPLEPTGPDRFRILTPTVHLEFEVKDGWLRSTRLK